MAEAKVATEELAQQVTTQWIQELQERGMVSPPLASLREVVVANIATLLESLTKPDWRSAYWPALRVFRFLADQFNLSLEQSVEIFLRLRPHFIAALTTLLGEVTARERVEEVWDEGILRLISRRQSSVRTALELALQKYRTLFEGASDAFFLVRLDREGTILEVNPAAAQLTGYPLEELHEASALILAPTDELERYATALQELRERGYVRVTGIGLKRKDGMSVFVDLSASLLTLEGIPHALCIVRDITEQQRLQRRLEEVVAHRTRELAEALERERRRAAQMGVWAEIAAEALEAVSEESVYQVAAKALREHLDLHNVALFSYDPGQQVLLLKACRGAYEKAWSPNYRQSVSIGLLGLAVRSGEPIVANDVRRHPDYFQATPEEVATRSELVVPIKLRGEIIGVLDLQSEKENAFDEQDLQMAQAVADQVAHALEAIAHFNHVRILQELNEQIVENLPYAVALLDEKGHVVLANEQFCQDVCRRPRQNVLHQPWQDLIPKDLQQNLTSLHLPPLEATIAAALQHRQDFFYPEVPYGDIWLDIRVIPIRGVQQNRVMLHIRDASLRVRRIYQLETLLAIAQAVEGTYEIHRLLHAILTAATAAPGLGFNRAILFLFDKTAQVLRVAMAVGALTAEEAYATWARLAAERKTLWDFLKEYPGDEAIRQTPLMQFLKDLVVPLDEENLLSLCLSRHEPLRIPLPYNEPRLPEPLRHLLGDAEAICIPLVAQDEKLGVIVADNAFSRHPITEESERLLRLFASSASIALRNAQLISELRAALEREQRMREQLVHSERLAAIGELAAKVAHDLRSPLVTIGGYARQLQRNPRDTERLQRNIQVIVDEVERLERQLRDLLDFATPKPPKLQRLNLSEIVLRLAEIHRPSMEAAGIDFVMEVTGDFFAMTDEFQIERVLLNLWRNAVEAMPDGGTITVRLWREGEWIKLSVSDTGVGIPTEELTTIFKPFYTTKSSGSGLGLAICKKIVDEHGGQIEVTSEVGKGTTFTISLPAVD